MERYGYSHGRLVMLNAQLAVESHQQTACGRPQRERWNSELVDQSRLT